MKIKTLTLLSLLILCLNLPLAAQTSLLKDAQSMSDDEAWLALTVPDSKGISKFGKCKISDASNCSNCFCPYYFLSKVKGKQSNFGWPKNPQTGDGNGCLGKGCWGGYTTKMCTDNVKANAKAILLDALVNNACE